MNVNNYDTPLECLKDCLMLWIATHPQDNKTAKDIYTFFKAAYKATNIKLDEKEEVKMANLTLGDVFRERREELHMNYSQVERRSGVPHDLVKRIEENRYRPKRLTLISIYRLSKLYKLPMNWIYQQLEEEINAGN